MTELKPAPKRSRAFMWLMAALAMLLALGVAFLVLGLQGVTAPDPFLKII